MARYISLRKNSPLYSATTSESVIPNEVVTFSDLNTIYFSSSEPAVYPLRTAEERLADNGLSEVHTSPDKEVIKSELARCFHCGRCTECDNCYIYCPDVAIAKKEGGFEMDYYFCKGCGVCAKECPRAAIEMIEEPTEI
jgi:2-oxoacid:acceptor oxidoreductase, delta subunit, pyruvate/2-ketoisovalerate family